MRARGRDHARRFLTSAIRRVSRCSYAVRAARPAGRRGPRAGTARRSRASTRTRARDGTGAHAHAHICAHIRTRPSPPARAPTRAARLSGCTRRAAVGGAGRLVEGGCRRASRWWAGRSCAARNQERRGVRRSARAGLPAAAQVFGPRGPVSVRWARSSRKRRAQMRPCARGLRRRCWRTRRPRRELPTSDGPPEPLHWTHTEPQAHPRPLSRPPYLRYGGSAGVTRVDPTERMRARMPGEAAYAYAVFPQE